MRVIQKLMEKITLLDLLKVKENKCRPNSLFVKKLNKKFKKKSVSKDGAFCNVFLIFPNWKIEKIIMNET